MKKLLLLLVCSLLVGCQQASKKVTYECSYQSKLDMYDVQLVDQLIGDEKSDKLEKMVSSFSLEYQTKDEPTIKLMLESIKNASKDIKGMTTHYDMKDGKASHSFEIDFEKADLAQIKKMNIIQGDQEQVDFVSIKDTLQNYKEGACQLKK